MQNKSYLKKITVQSITEKSNMSLQKEEVLAKESDSIYLINRVPFSIVVFKSIFVFLILRCKYRLLKLLIKKYNKKNVVVEKYKFQTELYQ